MDPGGSEWIKLSIFANSTLGTFTSAMINLWEIQVLRNPTSGEFDFYNMRPKSVMMVTVVARVRSVPDRGRLGRVVGQNSTDFLTPEHHLFARLDAFPNGPPHPPTVLLLAQSQTWLLWCELRQRALSAQHGNHGTWCGLAHGTWCVWACDQAARWCGLAHRPTEFREKSLFVGVHNTELMERGMVLLMERGVCGRVTMS